MNDDILLTPDECYEAEKRGTTAWSDAGAEPKELRAYINRELCRTQTRKVQLWMMTHFASAKKIDGAVQLTISEGDWRAFKAAGGE